MLAATTPDLRRGTVLVWMLVMLWPNPHRPRRIQGSGAGGLGKLPAAHHAGFSMANTALPEIGRALRFDNETVR
jgi:hypothetical protein